MKTVEIATEQSSIVTLPVRPLSSSKISQDHLQRLAIVYVRQSSPQQVMENRESTARQYALADYARLLGWAADRIIVIDEDQGQSGRYAENRSGFQRVLSEVTMEHVGIVLGLEMSRLARSSRDWHHLFELCGIFGTLLADQEGIYEANDPNDRLILGLKGIMSEMELQTMRNRLDRGRMNKAQRGEDYARFQRDKPLQLSEDERGRIDIVASAIPVLWNAERTTNADRKQIIRCIVERVVVHVRCDTEFVDVKIRWAGGYESQHEVIRAVATYAQLRDFDQLMSRVVELREAGHVAKEIADTLNAEGFYPPKRRGKFTSPVIYQLLKRRALIGNERDHNELLGDHEWWLTDLARELQMSHLKLRDWAKRKWVHSRKTPVQGRWVLWADDEEISRLRKLIENSKRGMNNFTSECTKPKPLPKSR